MRLRLSPWYTGLMLAVGASRLRELAVSRRNEAMLGGTRAADRTYPVMVAAHVALLTLPLLEVAAHPRVRPRWSWLGVLGAATLLRLWSIHSLGRAWNVRAAVPEEIHPVRSGPYAYVRHPNYVAVMMEFLALPLAGGAWRCAMALSVLNGLVLLDRIPAEERLLESSAAYREAFQGRPRFIPGLF